LANSDRSLADGQQEQSLSTDRNGAAPGAAAISLPRRVALTLLAADTFGLVLFFNLAYWIRLDLLPWFTPGMLIPLGLLVLSMYVVDTYTLERQVSGMRPPARAVVGVGVAGVLTGATAYAGGFWSVDPTFGRGVFPVAFAAQAAWSALWRLGLAVWMRQQAERIRWLVIGAGEQALSLREDFAKSGTQGELVFLSEYDGADAAAADLAPVGGIGDLERISSGHWSGVVVALTNPAPEPLVHQLMDLRFSGVRVYGIADFYEQLWFKVPVMHTRHGWLVFAHGFDLLHNPLGLRIKRLLDVFFALALLVVASPAMALVALLVRVERQGPVIFRQARTGLGGTEFEVLKFRSMTQDAEQDGPQWAQDADPRITRVGRIIRLLHIDELPQLINVLKGEMSFIGPRPERPVFNATLESEIPHYNLRHLVRPGITGWAQVMYPYGASVEDAREKLQYDLYYIKNYSVLLDIGIVFKTLRVVLLGKGQ
jgi:exopolysaccharide biosynthesis polyprenyl glycosylphosphotransferase